MNIRSLAAYERARRALSGVCEPSDIRRRVRFLVREFVSPYEVSAGDGEAMLRTHSAQSLTAEQSYF